MTQRVLAKLGPFTFSIDTAAFASKSRDTEYRYESMKPLGSPILQFLGLGDDRIQLPGVIYPHYAGGLGQLEEIRKLAGNGEPLRLVDGMGNVHGRWVIKRVKDTEDTFLPGSAPRRIRFTISLERFHG